jgi:hypothetical protein
VRRRRQFEIEVSLYSKRGEAVRIPKKVVETVEAKSVEVHVKVCDSGIYTLKGQDGKKLAEIDEDYVPKFFPGEHYGDYLILDIDLASGKILNWQEPDPMTVADAFGMVADDE